MLRLFAIFPTCVCVSVMYAYVYSTYTYMYCIMAVYFSTLAISLFIDYDHERYKYPTTNAEIAENGRAINHKVLSQFRPHHFVLVRDVNMTVARKALDFAH